MANTNPTHGSVGRLTVKILAVVNIKLLLSILKKHFFIDYCSISTIITVVYDLLIYFKFKQGMPWLKKIKTLIRMVKKNHQKC